jgi:C2 domain.
MYGSLKIKPLACRLYLAEPMMQSLKPVCRIYVGRDSAKTQIGTVGTDEINWDEEFTLKRDLLTNLHIEIWDHVAEDNNNLIGVGDIGFNIFEVDNKINDWISLYNPRGKRIGTVLVEAEFTPALSQKLEPTTQDVDISTGLTHDSDFWLRSYTDRVREEALITPTSKKGQQGEEGLFDTANNKAFIG